MSLFGISKPRGFKPPGIYVDERRERIERLVRQTSSDNASQSRFDAGEFSEHWQEATSRLKCRRGRSSSLAVIWMLILASVLFYLLAC